MKDNVLESVVTELTETVSIDIIEMIQSIVMIMSGLLVLVIGIGFFIRFIKNILWNSTTDSFNGFTNYSSDGYINGSDFYAFDDDDPPCGFDENGEFYTFDDDDYRD